MMIQITDSTGIGRADVRARVAGGLRPYGL